MHLASLLDRAARRHPDRVAVVCGRASLTYREFARRTAMMADTLRAAGVRAGRRVAVLLPNCHRYLEAYFAAAALDAVLVPLNRRLVAPETAAILRDSATCCLLSDEENLGQVIAAIDELAPDEQPNLVSVNVRPATEVERFRAAFDDEVEPDDAPGLPFGVAGIDAPAQLYYTSGTTGEPKGVILTHGNVASHAEAAVAALGLSADDVWLHAAPLFHLADAWATWAVTLVGGRHVMLPEYSAIGLLDAIETHGVTITNLVPTMLADVVACPEAKPHRLRSMRRILSGGAPMALELLKRVESLVPCEYVQTYGLTETSPYLTLSLLDDELLELPPEEQQRIRATTGRPMRGVEVRVIDESGQDVARNGATVGEIIARGPTVTPGYWRRPDLTDEAIRDGWLHTGDLAQVDARGYLTIVDRLKDVINPGGELVYSIEVENALYEHPAVREAAVIAVPDERWGEAVLAVVALREEYGLVDDVDEAADAAILQAHCRARLAGYKVPRDVFFVDALPRTGSGKISKRVLRGLFGGEQ